MLEYIYESKAHAEGYATVCGIDEAGRGPLCGPVVAAACILPPGLVIEKLNDSKKLSPKRRDELFDIIKENALSFSVASASVEEIDGLNILEATLLAMRRAVAGLTVKPDYLLVDGNVFRGFGIKGESVVSGDALSPSIAAASILAKVSRDRLMVEYAKQYPDYGFDKHKGYGTKAHLEALEKYGVTPILRRSYRPVFEAMQDRLF